MRKMEIQKEYLQVQVSLGVLIEQASDADKAILRNISVQLVKIKRNMIGSYDEVEADVAL